MEIKDQIVKTKCQMINESENDAGRLKVYLCSISTFTFTPQHSQFNIIIQMENMNINSNNRLNMQPNNAQNAQRPPINNIHRPNTQPRSYIQRINHMFRTRITIQNILYIEKHKILLLSGRVKIQNPQQQGFLSVVKNQLFPSLSLVSLASFLMLINLILYIVELSLGFNQDGSILEIKEQTLMLLGMNNSLRVCQGQVYRLVVAQYLHVNLLHFITNNLIILLIIPKFQYSFGPIKVFLIYVISAISGNILSNILQNSNTVKAGPAVSLCGMVGLGVGYIIINWQGLKMVGFLFKVKLITYIILIGLFLLLYSDVISNTDYFGYLGAFFSGLLLSFINQPINNNQRQKVSRIIFTILWVIYFVMCFVIFYIIKKSNYCP